MLKRRVAGAAAGALGIESSELTRRRGLVSAAGTGGGWPRRSVLRQASEIAYFDGSSITLVSKGLT